MPDINLNNVASQTEVNSIDARVTTLENNQFANSIVVQTYADEGGGLTFLPVTGTENVSYKVANDPDTAKNGYYHWEDTLSDYVKDADLANGLIEENNPDAISGGTAWLKFEDVDFNKVDKEFLFEGINIYNYLNDTTGYISDATGEVLSNATSYVSEKIPVTGGENYYLFNRTGERGLVFYDATDTELKPYDLNGVEYTLFRIPSLNGGFQAPPTAVSVRFTTQFVGTGNRENTVLQDTPEQGIFIKPELIKDTAYKNLIIDSGELYFASDYDDSNKVVMPAIISPSNTFTTSNLFDFKNEYLANPDDLLTSLGTIKTSSDDTCPLYLNGSYIGAGHGWNRARVLTMTSHGKTLADVGSIYTDGSVNYVILRIVDADKLWICSENQAVDGYSYSFVSPTLTLTYVSDGVNTADITGYSQVELSNLFSTTGQSEIKLFADGVEIDTTDKVIACNKLVVQERYFIYDLPSILTELTAQRPGGGYLTQPFFNELGADVLATVDNTYTYDLNSSMVVGRSVFANKKLTSRFDGIVQFGPLTTGSLYIPKLDSVTVGANTYDFKNIEDLSSNFPASINIKSTDWISPTNPADRFINFNNDYIIHGGYIRNVGLGKIMETTVNDNSFLISTVRKIYPFIKSDSPAEIMEVNDFYSGVAFRQIKKTSDNPTGRLNYTYVDNNGSVYLFVDYNDTMMDKLEINPDWVGKEIEVVDSYNVSCLSDVFTSFISISSTATAVDTGYIVLKVK